MPRHKRPKRVSEISEKTLRVIADIIGNGAAAEKAINELQVRRERGEKDITCYVYGPMYFVGPKLQNH